MKEARMCKILVLFVISTIFILSTINVRSEEYSQSLEKTFPLIGCSNTAWVRKYENRYLMYVRGSHYEMGYQHGAMLSSEVRKTLIAYINSVPETFDELLYVYSCGEKYIPSEYKEEMKGLADGAGIDINIVHAAHAIPTLHHCSGFAVWGAATKDGRVYHTRSLDYGVTIADPTSGETVQMHSTVILRRPKQGYISIVPSWAGFVGSVDGLNEKKISIGEMGQSTDDYTYHGLFMIFRLRYTLERASNMEEAINYMSIDRECGYSFIVADGNKNEAQMIEQTWHHYYNGSWNHIEEANGYNVMHYQIPFAVRRGNHMIAYSTAMTQRDVYLMLPTDGDFLHLINYLILSEGIEKNYGKIDFDKAQEIFVEAYRKYPFQFTLHQVIFSPSDLRMRVGDAYPDGTGAFWNTFHEYSIPDILSMPEILNITHPQNGSVVSGTIVIKPKILDGYVPNIVRLYVDGIEKANITQPPYELTLDTTTLTNGYHTLELRAYGNNFSAISYITVRVFNPFSSPEKIEKQLWKAEIDEKDGVVLTASDLIKNMRIPKVLAEFKVGRNDLVIDTTYYINNTNMIVNGSVIVKDRGRLIIMNSTLAINSTEDGKNGVIVMNGGSLLMINSTLKNYTKKRIFVYAQPYAKEIKIIGSRIMGGGHSIEKPLIYISCDNISVEKSTIIHSSYGLIINGENTLYNVKINNTVFYIQDPEYLPIKDIYTPRGASLLLGNVERGVVENIRIKGIKNGKLFSFGILLVNSKYCFIRNIEVENEYVGIGMLSSSNNLAKDFCVLNSHIGVGILMGSRYNVIENGRVEHCAGGVGNVYNSPFNVIRKISINDTNIAIGAQESEGVIFENIRICNNGGVMFDKAERFILRNSSIESKYCGIIIKSRCHYSILENLTITLQKDLYGIGVGRTTNLVLKNIRVYGARYALHLEGRDPSEYKMKVSNFTTPYGEVKYYWGSAPSEISGGQILIGGISNMELNISTSYSPVYIFYSDKITLKVNITNAVNGLVVYHSTALKVRGNVINSSSYGLMLYNVNGAEIDMSASRCCWAYALHHSNDVIIKGVVKDIKDSVLYSIYSQAIIDVISSPSSYGVISRFSVIYFIRNISKALYYYHIYNSTVYVCNYLHVYVYDLNGNPLSNATVNISFNNVLLFSRKTDNNGYARIVAPYAVWYSNQLIKNLTLVEVWKDNIQFEANPRMVDMSVERTEIFREILLSEFSVILLAMAVCLIISVEIIRKLF